MALTTAQIAAAATQFADKFVAGPHIGRGDFAVVGEFKIVNEGEVGVAFPDEQAQSRFRLFAGRRVEREDE